MAALPICEYVDIDGTTVRFAVRFPGQDAAEGDQAQARLRSRWGKTRAHRSARLRTRVNTVGEESRSLAIFEFDTRELGTGTLRLEVSGPPRPGQEESAETQFRKVDPATGLLASSRPVELGGNTAQVFPGVDRSTWLRIGRPTPGGRAWWAVVNTARDVAFAARARRFSWVRLARLLTRPFVPRGPIWLIGERQETARDNGWAFFTYARRRSPGAAIFYVIDGASAHRQGLSDPNLLVHSSLRHKVLMLHADALINAYSIKHMLPDTWHPGAYMKQAAWRIGAKRVYLKHGVHLSPTAVKRANGGYHLLCTVGPGETAALASGSGYSSELRVTGLARYDTLTPRGTQRSILFMPTWRRYLVPTLFGAGGDAEVPFHGSTYERFIDEFLNSKALAELLERFDLTLDFVPHHNLAGVLGEWTPPPGQDRIRFHDPRAADIPGLIRGAAMLCTDYSSVHFDAAYLGIPVVYAQVDRAEYLAGHSALPWFDFDTDGFGPVAHATDEAIAELHRYAAADFAREPEYEERLARVFTFRDERNCERIFDAVAGL